ncbi:MAG: hypothetical protein AAGB00_09770 [Planctomycetota bacterium]
MRNAILHPASAAYALSVLAVLLAAPDALGASDDIFELATGARTARAPAADPPRRGPKQAAPTKRAAGESSTGKTPEDASDDVFEPLAVAAKQPVPKAPLTPNRPRPTPWRSHGRVNPFRQPAATAKQSSAKRSPRSGTPLTADAVDAADTPNVIEPNRHVELDAPIESSEAEFTAIEQLGAEMQTELDADFEATIRLAVQLDPTGGAGSLFHRTPPEPIAPPAASEPNGAAAKSGRPEPTLISIREATVDTTPRSRTIDDEETSTDLPRDMAIDRFGGYGGARLSGNERVRFATLKYLWNSPAMRHKPLYFEQPNLERYGSGCGNNLLSSAASAGHFLGSTLSLPYQIGAQPPRECVYTLGVYRPGNCNPHFVHLSRPSAKGLALQGAAVTGLVLLFP